jgi:HSP20 family protein
MAIIRFNPLRDLLNVEREFSRLFKSFEDRYGISKNEDSVNGYENAVWMPLTDIFESKDNYKIKADLPGMKKEDVKISFSEGQLSISGERVQEQESKNTKCHRVERTYGKYYRLFNLPKEIKEDKIKAEFKDGQLTISILKADEVKPKEIEIKVN